MKTMRTQAVFITILALLSLSSSALYFPADSHNNPHFPSTVAVVDSDIPPTRIVKRQVEASTTTTPIMSISTMNPAAWTSDTNTACLNAINASAIINPAGVVPCYNVLMYNPTNGEFLSEVRLFQVNNMVQASVVAGSTGSNVLFEFPHATINGSPGETDIQNLLTKRGVVLERASNIGDVTIVDAFYMNGTADITQSESAEQLLTPTTATLSLNISGIFTPFSMTGSMVLFVNGLFTPSFNAAQTNSTSAGATQASPAGFVLPGISFGIVPIGFYMFSAYWVVFTAVLLWGAWNKRKYRDAFRKRRAAVLNFTAVKPSY